MTAERDDLRDDGVVRAWREHVRDTPPAAVDDAIRAAARRAVGAKPREKALVAEARGPWRWWMPLAAAATIGAVAIGVLQNMPQEGVEPTVVSDAVTARRAAPAAPAETLRATPAAPMQAAPPMAAAPSPQERASAKKTESAVVAEQRDNTPLPMPRTQPQREAPPATAPVPASAPKVRQDATKPDAAPQLAADAPSESKEKTSVPPPSDDRQRAASLSDKQEPVAALEKRAPSKDVEPRRNERDAASGFVASPPASAPAPAVTDSLGAARESSNAAEPAARAKQRASTAQGMGAASSPPPAGVRAMAEPQSMAVTPPDVFVAEIRRLLAIGDRDGAVRELQRFRRTHVDADARLPVELREFAATVPR